MANRFTRVIKRFPQSFWTANTMELFERWAWYGMFMVLALYLTGSRDTGALGFTQSQKGFLMGTVVAILYFLPVITGAIADRFGYKRVLIVSYAILTVGYFLMSVVTSYGGMFVVFLFVAVGAALFKPVISATISKTTDDETSSIGFGFFYMMVNVGAFIGPIFAAKFRELDWQYVFWLSSLVIAVNFILVIFFYKEPARAQSEEPLGKSILTILKNIYIALKDFKFLVFLIIIVGFWTMYNQLFYTLPVFIEQWVDTTVVYDALASISPGLANAIGTGRGTIAPEMMTNIDAGYIVLFQLLISTLVMRFKPLNAMISGIFIAGIGLGLTFMTQNGLYLIVTILVFAVGEMASSPKIIEYIGKIAPKDKVALYMGCSFLPMAGGNFFAGILSGDVYEAVAGKMTLLKKEVAARGLDVPKISE
ncbi:MAG: MFS transporter, partial [Bacteroidales bacterium]|nr:MFS transporter [Bacteroidales bacterium]